MELVSVIEYQGDNKTVVWKHPTVNFNNNSQLIVRESQEAIFFLNGQALDSLGPGEHILETGKIPLLSEKLEKIVGGEVFHSEIYFVNLVEQMSINWGTNPRIKFIDKTAGDYQFDLGMFGKLSLKISNPRKLVQNFVGTEDSLGQEKLLSYIRPHIMQKVRSVISKTINQQSISIFELDMHVEELACILLAAFRNEISEYGIDVTGFWIEGFDFPENDPTYKKIRELRGQRVTAMQEQKIKQELARDELEFGKDYEVERANLDAEKEIIKARAEGEKTVIEANAMATKRATEGITIIEEKAYEVAKSLAENDNVGNLASSGVGIGMMGGMAFGVGNAMSNMMSDALSPINSSKNSNNMSEIDMPSHITMEEEALGDNEFEERIRKLKVARENDFISEEEFQEKKKEILDSI